MIIKAPHYISCSAALALTLSVMACGGGPAPAASNPVAAPAPAQHVPLGQLPAIDNALLLADTRTLSSDQF
jgi:hypothetical protein